MLYIRQAVTVTLVVTNKLTGSSKTQGSVTASLAVHHTLTTYLSTNHQLIMTSYLVLDKFLYSNRTEMDTMLTMVNVGICIHRGTWRLRFHHFDFDTERYTGGK